MKVFLEVIGGPLDGQTYTFTKSITIGRDPACEIPIDLDNYLSRKHAQILVIPPECFLEDLNSRNGTFIGEEKLSQRVLLKNGQQFRVGKTVMEIKWESG